MVTINDVAAHAGVGKGTVSRVLNGGGKVSPATRARVDAAIAELGYTPSYAARSLARGRVPTVAVVVPFVTHPSAVSRVRGVIEGLRPSGLPVSILDVETPEHARAHFVSILDSLRPEGVIVVSLVPDIEIRQRLFDARVPIVWVDATVPDHASVNIDNVAGGRMATEHLIGLGHVDIAFIGDDETGGFGFTSAAERRSGFVAAMREHRLDPRRVRLGPHDQDVARRLATELLTEPQRPTGIVTTSDTQALGVLAAALALGLSVPGDLSVVGFDDVDLAALVGLTTVRQPIAESGQQAARLLLAAIDDPSVDRSQVQLPLELIERRSSGAVSGSAGASISNHN
jgi:LacI family transcriptional regulator